MIFAAKTLRKLDDAAVEKRHARWSRVGAMIREERLLYWMVGFAVLCAGALFAGVVSPTVGAFVLSGFTATSLACFIGFPKYVARLASEKERRAEAATLEREKAEQARLYALAHMPDLGNDFRAGTMRELGVKPALKLKTPLALHIPNLK